MPGWPGFRLKPQTHWKLTAQGIWAIENPCPRILGHPRGSRLLRRDPFGLDVGLMQRRAAELRVVGEHNAAPERLDPNHRDLRPVKELGCRIFISADSHDARNLEKMSHGVKQLRRARLSPTEVLNTLEAEEFLAALRPRE